MFTYQALIQFAVEHQDELLSSHAKQLDFLKNVLSSIKLGDYFLANDAKNLENEMLRFYQQASLQALNDVEWDEFLEKLKKLGEFTYELKGQAWFTHKMEAAGYSLLQVGLSFGECQGIVNMAMQAFFLSEMDVFNERLKLIDELPLSYFKDDFSGAKAQIQVLPETNMLEKAAEAQDKLNNIRAFFDGVALNAFARTYRAWFGIKRRINIPLQMPSERVMPLTAPDALSFDSQMPSYLSSVYGAYSKDEMVAYFQMLENSLGDLPFALQIKSSNHVIGIFYDTKQKAWYHVQPDHLPAEIVSNIEALVDLVRHDFLTHPRSDEDQFPITTNLYVRDKDHYLAKVILTQLEQTEAWGKPHGRAPFSDKYVKVCEYRGGHHPLFDVLQHERLEWFDEQLSQLDEPTILKNVLYYLKQLPVRLDEHEDNKEAPYDKAVFNAVKKCIYKHLSPLKQAEYACEMDDPETLSRLISAGVKPTSDMLEAALSDKSYLVVPVLMQYVKPDKYCLLAAYHPKQKNELLFSMLEGFNPPPEGLLNKAVWAGDESMMNMLLKLGAVPSAYTVQNLSEKYPRVIKKIADFGLNLPLSLIEKIYTKGHVTLAREFIDSRRFFVDDKFNTGRVNEQVSAMLHDFLAHGMSVSDILFRACFNKDISLIEALLQGMGDVTPTVLNKIFSRYNTDIEVLNCLIKQKITPAPHVLFRVLETHVLGDRIERNFIPGLVNAIPEVAYEVFVLACNESERMIIDSLLDNGLTLSREQCDEIQNEDMREYVVSKLQLPEQRDGGYRLR